MLEHGGLIGLLILILDIWAIVTILGGGSSTKDKILWVLIILLLPVFGLLLWLVLNRR